VCSWLNDDPVRWARAVAVLVDECSPCIVQDRNAPVLVTIARECRAQRGCDPGRCVQGCARALSARCGGLFVAVEYDVPYVMHMFPIICTRVFCSMSVLHVDCARGCHCGLGFLLQSLPGHSRNLLSVDVNVATGAKNP
jgi:hypothetical protein